MSVEGRILVVDDHVEMGLMLREPLMDAGYTVDLAALSAAARQHGVLLVVDAIQSVGQMPVDVTATPVDILACGAQKWLLSPWGS